MPENAKGLASCYDVISMLEHQLRTARALLDELRERPSPETSMSLVVDYCAELRAEAQLPRTRPDSKPHKALVDKIHVESAAYLKIADAARGAERKADARNDGPAG